MEHEISDESDLQMIGRRSSSFAGSNFDPALVQWNALKILVVGAGGLGCEMLHCLALSGFTDITVVDMDTIELSNLNRQFLFRECHIGQFKAVVAAETINRRFPWMHVKHHACPVETLSPSFYEGFHIVLLGLDSMHARWFVNDTYVKLEQLRRLRARILWKASNAPRPLQHDKGDVSPTDVAAFEEFLGPGVVLLDGGTEGMRGSLQRVEYGRTACIECTTPLYHTDAHAAPLCTIANTPRSLEHCVSFATELLWTRVWPFGKGERLDSDDPEHIRWVQMRAEQHAQEFGLLPPSSFAEAGPLIPSEFVVGVVKSIIPSVGFTNAIIGGLAVTEAVRVATDMTLGVGGGGHTSYTGDHAAFGETLLLERRASCEACASWREPIRCSADVTVDHLVASELQSVVSAYLAESGSMMQPNSDGCPTETDFQVSLNLQRDAGEAEERESPASLVLHFAEHHPRRGENRRLSCGTLRGLVAEHVGQHFERDMTAGGSLALLGEITGGVVGSRVLSFILCVDW